jgi:hypothetical protein
LFSAARPFENRLPLIRAIKGRSCGQKTSQQKRFKLSCNGDYDIGAAEATLTSELSSRLCQFAHSGLLKQNPIKQNLIKQNQIKENALKHGLTKPSANANTAMPLLVPSDPDLEQNLPLMSQRSRVIGSDKVPCDGPSQLKQQLILVTSTLEIQHHAARRWQGLCTPTLNTRSRL